MTNPPTLQEALLGIASRSMIRVFEAYGQRLQPIYRAGPGAPPLEALARQGGFRPPTLAASVAFFGPQIRGYLLIASNQEVIGQTRPTLSLSSSPRSATSEIMARDWISELANQALGLFKNRLRKHGISFEASAPSPLSGAPVAALIPKTAAAHFLLFRCAGGAVWCGLNVACDFTMSAALADEDLEHDDDDDFTSLAGP